MLCVKNERNYSVLISFLHNRKVNVLLDVISSVVFTEGISQLSH